MTPPRLHSNLADAPKWLGLKLTQGPRSSMFISGLSLSLGPHVSRLGPPSLPAHPRFWASQRIVLNLTFGRLSNGRNLARAALVSKTRFATSWRIHIVPQCACHHLCRR